MRPLGLVGARMKARRDLPNSMAAALGRRHFLGISLAALVLAPSLGSQPLRRHDPVVKGWLLTAEDLS